NICASAAASAPEGNSHTGACQDSTHQTGSDGILHKRRCRNRNQCQKQRLAEDADNGPDKKAPAYGKIGQKEQRNIQYKVNNTRYIRAAHAEVCVSYQKSTQNLADSHDAAAVKIR